MDYAKEAERHREMAEEYREMAEYATDEGLRVQYSNLAEANDGLADNAEQVARHLKIAN